MKKQIYSMAGGLIVVFLTTFAVSAQIAVGGNYTLNQSVIAAGGGTGTDATGNAYKVESTIGEAIAGTTSTGSPYSLRGGFVTADAAFVPTAAAVTVSGRVLTRDGRGIRNVIITMTGFDGAARTAISTAFGYFNFADVSPGATYIFTARAKRFTFSQPQQIHSITENTEGIVFVGDANYSSNLP